MAAPAAAKRSAWSWTSARWSSPTSCTTRRAAAARQSWSRPKERKIDTDFELHQRITGHLVKGWSPEQIAGRIRYEEDAERQICPFRTRRSARGSMRTREQGARIAGVLPAGQCVYYASVALYELPNLLELAGQPPRWIVLSRLPDDREHRVCPVMSMIVTIGTHSDRPIVGEPKQCSPRLRWTCADGRRASGCHGQVRQRPPGTFGDWLWIESAPQRISRNWRSR